MKILQTEQTLNSDGTYSVIGLVSQQGEFNQWFTFYKNLTAKEVDAKESDLLEMSEEELSDKFSYYELEEA